MEKTISSSFFEKDQLKIFLILDERFAKLKIGRKEAVLNVLSGESKEEIFKLNKTEWNIVTDTRGY